MIWRVMRLDFDLARTASGWCECKNWEPAIKRSFCIEGRGINSHRRRPSPLVIWPGIISSVRRHQKGMHRYPKDPYALDHATVGLVKGMEENYAWMGQHWPDSRYIVITLSFDTQGEEKPSPWIEGWPFVYDLKTGAFSGAP